MFSDFYKWIDLPRIVDHRGALTVMELGQQIPFDIKRIYFLSEVPDSKRRGAHAHRELHQILIPVHGSFFIELNDGVEKTKLFLDNPRRGLYIAPSIWRELYDFEKGAICLSLVSDFYNEADYIRNYNDFLKEVAASQVCS